MTWLSLIFGLVLLTGGAELLIRGATGLARRFGLSELLIGLTLVGFGTSTPELVSSVQAARIGSPGVAIGNVVGSNIANILLILGLSAAITPIAVEPKAFRRDSIALILATVLLIALALGGEFGRLAGAGLLAALVLYITAAYLTERRAPAGPETVRHEAEAAALPATGHRPAVNVVTALFGLALLIVGARVFVTGAIEIATSLGVTETVIGLTVVAVGTSLPELTTSAVAALRGRSALALGNVIGSNIYNTLGILGATALVHPIAAPAQIVRTDNWVMLAATLLMLAFAHTQMRVARWEGGVLLVSYIGYIAWLVAGAPAG